MAMNLRRNLGLFVSGRLSSAGSAARPLRVSGARQYHGFFDSEFLGTSPAGWLLWLGALAGYVWWLGFDDLRKPRLERRERHKIEMSLLKQEIEKLKAEVEHGREENEVLKKSSAHMRNADPRCGDKA